MLLLADTPSRRSTAYIWEQFAKDVPVTRTLRNAQTIMRVSWSNWPPRGAMAMKRIFFVMVGGFIGVGFDRAGPPTPTHRYAATQFGCPAS
jgi:hypothetical protein